MIFRACAGGACPGNPVRLGVNMKDILFATALGVIGALFLFLSL